jgi:hypothetical protein
MEQVIVQIGESYAGATSLRGRCRREVLAMKTGEQIKNQRKHDAEQDGCSKREINRHVLAAIGKIARQFAQRESYPAQEQDYPSCNEQEETESDQQPA